MLRRKWAVGSVCVFTRDGDATETTNRPCFYQRRHARRAQPAAASFWDSYEQRTSSEEKKRKEKTLGACRNTFSNPEVHSLLTHHPTSSFRYLNDIALKLMIYQKTTDAA
jgi:hypothetical protein